MNNPRNENSSDLTELMIRGDSLRISGKYREAIEIYDKILKEDPLLKETLISKLKALKLSGGNENEIKEVENDLYYIEGEEEEIKETEEMWNKINNPDNLEDPPNWYGGTREDWDNYKDS
jgi:tetratricopeptide (TPR) repeat protein